MNKMDRFIARYILGWKFCMHPGSEPGVLVTPDKEHLLGRKEDLPNFSGNDVDACKALHYLMNKDKELRVSIKAGYSKSIQAFYFSVVLKKLENDKLLLYNGDSRYLKEAIVECLIKYSGITDYHQMLDKA